MQTIVKEWLTTKAASGFFEGPIVEIGSRPAIGQEEIAHLRGLFPGLRYVGVDMQPGPNVDLVCSAERIGLPSGYAGTVLSIDALEHIWDVRSTIQEMYRLLRPGGHVVMTSVFAFRIHAHPDDYWRFTPSCFNRLLSEAGFHGVNVEAWGQQKSPVQIVGVATK